MTAVQWHRQTMVAVDTETTCADPNTARLVTATVVRIEPGHEPHVTQWLAKPDVPIAAGATAVHGITDARAQEDGTATDVVLAELLAIIGPALHRGIPVVAFNAAFDLTVLDRECRRRDVDPLDTRLDQVAPVVDPHVLDKHVTPYRKGKRTLDVTCAHHGILLRDAHDSAADALAAARLAYRLAERFGDELQIPLEELHARQQTWRTGQAASLQAYFQRRDPDAVVNGAWPVQPLPDDWDPAHHPSDDKEAGAA